MQKYSYKAFNKEFKIENGFIEEEDLETAKQRLKVQGFSIIDIKESKDIKELDIFKVKLKNEELASFCGQLAIIINSGINIVNGLEILKQQSKTKKMKKIIENISIGVSRGKPLAKAMSDTGSFPKLLTDMVDSGELSGNIDTMLWNMESFYEKEAAVRNKIKGASVYPAILLIVSFGMIVFFNYFVFSELKDLFNDSKKLPMITKLLIAFMNFFNNNIIWIIVTLILLILGLRYIKTIKEVKYFIDRITIKLPFISGVKRDIITSRFTWSMALFLKAAVPVLSILDSIKLIIDNEYYSRKIDNIKMQMINGNSMADAIGSEDIFEPLVIQMIRVGEEAGKLEDTMFKLSDIYGKRVDGGISRLVAMVEPVFTLFVGIFVGIIILAMAMPIMQMSSSMQ